MGKRKFPLGTKTLPDIKKIQWKETHRKTAYEYWELNPEGPIPRDFFCESKGPRIPPDIGDAFCYRARSEVLEFVFGQKYTMHWPMSTNQFLAIEFHDERMDIDDGHPLRGGESFGFLSEVSVEFWRELYGGGKHHIKMMSQNAGMQNTQNEDRNQGLVRSNQTELIQSPIQSRPNNFSPHGENFMENLLSRKNDILQIVGLKPKENDLLRSTLDLIEKEYREGIMEPHSKMYT